MHTRVRVRNMVVNLQPFVTERVNEVVGQSRHFATSPIDCRVRKSESLAMSVYELISQQAGNLFCFFLIILCGYIAWKKYKRWRTDSKEKFLPYKVIKPPSALASERGDAGKKKRVCAVLGGTGFIGSQVVNELVQRGEYYVYVLGRTFRPERTNPDADCLIQVDMLDVDGLVKAFQGVDSVINAAAFIPTVFTKADEARRVNKTGFDNILKAVKEARVKNLVHLSGFPISVRIKNPVLRAFWATKQSFIEQVKNANGKDGLSTCVIGPTNIVGLSSQLFKYVISGKVAKMLMPDKMPISFMPVEYLARALVNAEAKLAEGDNQIAGKVFPLRGEPMSWKTFFQLPTWPHKVKEPSNWMLSLSVKINVFCANVFGWAPFGPYLCAAILEVIEVVESGEITSIQVNEAYDLLGVGPPSPPMEEYIAEIVKKYKVIQESQKEK